MEKSPVTKLVSNRLKFKIYLLQKLPLALIVGLRIKEFDGHMAAVSLPYNYWTKNPFRSVYFAAQSMAAELASGLLAMHYVSSQDKAVSMLVLGMRAEFVKKAKTSSCFLCEDGDKIKAAVQACLQSNEGKTVEACCTGWDKNKEEVARFWFTWTFKPKQHN
jgi:hypothetical protein